MLMNETEESKSKWLVGLKRHIKTWYLAHKFEIITVLSTEHHLLVPCVKSSGKSCQVKVILHSAHHRHNRSLALKTWATRSVCVQRSVCCEQDSCADGASCVSHLFSPSFIETPSILDL